MKLFTKKEKIVIHSENQKDEFIEKLEHAHVGYDIREDRDSMFSDKISYIFRVNTADLKKVV